MQYFHIGSKISLVDSYLMYRADSVVQLSHFIKEMIVLLENIGECYNIVWKSFIIKVSS